MTLEWEESTDYADYTEGRANTQETIWLSTADPRLLICIICEICGFLLLFVSHTL